MNGSICIYTACVDDMSTKVSWLLTPKADNYKHNMVHMDTSRIVWSIKCHHSAAYITRNSWTAAISNSSDKNRS